MFLHLSVSHSVHRGASASVHAGMHTSTEADTPWKQTPPLEADTPTPRAVHAGREGQQAGGTRPTGMHICY